MPWRTNTGLRSSATHSHAQGATWRGRPHGAYYDIVCSSLGKGKLLSGGELGVVVANDDRQLDRMLLFGHVNRIPDAFRTEEYRHMHNSVGVKYRPHTFALALALAQLDSYRERTERLVDNIRRFEAGLAGIEGFEPFGSPRAAERVYWRVPVRIDPVRVGSVESVIARLRRHGCPVEVEKSGPLVHRHNAMTDFYRVRTPETFPVAAKIVDESILLHAFPFFRDAVAEQVLEALRSVSGLAAAE